MKEELFVESKTSVREKVFGERKRVHSIIMRGRLFPSMEYSEDAEPCGQRKARWASGGMAPDEAGPL